MTRVEERLNGKPIDLERGCAGWSARFYTATAMDFTRRWNACSTRSCDQFQWRSAVIRKAVGELSWRKTSLLKGMESKQRRPSGNGIYQRYTDLVEPFSIDESWLDVTGSRELFGGGKKIADELRKAVREETGVTISVGVSFNKVFAKLGSDYKKPDATTVISRENFRELLWPLPVDRMIFVGDSSKAALEKLRVRTIGDLARLDRELLEKKLGKQGAALSLYANGLDKSPVRSVYEEREVKSIGNSITFKRNLTGIEDIRLGVRAIADQVASRLRRHRVKCATVQVVIKDPDFRVISRQRPLKRPTHLSRDLYECALAIILDSWKITAPIRMLSITGANLVGDGEDTIQEQLSLFDPPGEREAEERQENLETALDEIRAKFGREAVSFGSVIHNDLGIRDHKKEL